jgi:hypothetical protein
MYRQETAVVFSDGAIEIEFQKKKTETLLDRAQLEKVSLWPNGFGFMLSF